MQRGLQNILYSTRGLIFAAAHAVATHVVPFEASYGDTTVFKCRGHFSPVDGVPFRAEGRA